MLKLSKVLAKPELDGLANNYSYSYIKLTHRWVGYPIELDRVTWFPQGIHFFCEDKLGLHSQLN